MKILFALVAVSLLVSVIDAAPKAANRKRAGNKPTAARKNIALAAAHKKVNSVEKAPQRAEKSKRQIAFLLPGNAAVEPNYYAQHSAPPALIDFQSALHAAFLSGVHYAELEKYLKKQNLTDSSGKPSPLEAKTLAVFEALFGEKKDDAKSSAVDSKTKFIAFDGSSNVNIVDPFSLANNGDGKFLKADNGVPSDRAGKLGNANSSVVASVNPYHSSGHVETVFGPEIAPRYEIHYSPGQGLTLDPLTPFAGAGVSSAAVGVAPVGPAAYGAAAIGSAYGPAAYGPEIGPFDGFGIAPNFNSLAGPYPYPYPFLSGFDPKSLKPNGKGGDEKKLDSTDLPTESTSQSYPEASSETPAEAAPSESPSEPPSESPASEAPQ